MHMISTILFTAALALAAPAVKRDNSTAAASGTTTDQNLPAIVKANPRAGDKSLIQSLMLAPTQKQRVNLLNQPGDGIFDFLNPPEGSVATGNGGHLVSANADTFPALIGNGAALSIAFLGPCGLNSPHVHNRATELNVPVQGRLVTSFFEENGVTAREDLLNTYTMAVFPQGAIHAEYNPDCEDAVFVAGFNSADPGVEQVAQAFFNLRPDIVQATLNGVSVLNGEDIESFKDSLPANIVQGVESCLNKCGIAKKAKRDLAEVFGA